MQQPISGFHQDAEGHWVADLACGHGQHVRHDPPWQVREWVLEDATRHAHLGTLLDCVLCDAERGSPTPMPTPMREYAASAMTVRSRSRGRVCHRASASPLSCGAPEAYCSASG